MPSRKRELLTFAPECRDCPRLSRHLDEVKAEHPEYFCRPVPSFGDACARLLIVGLAPGKPGANATGRPFTGDHAGILLYRTLHAFGFANRPESLGPRDGLRLRACRITNAVKCLPPDNRPVGEEVDRCNGYLREEIRQLAPGALVLALGAVAHRAVLKALRLRQAEFPFGHGRQHQLGDRRRLIDSYHCSRYNTQTGRLTPAMFNEVFAAIRSQLGAL